MNYTEFKAAYTLAFNNMMKYTPDQVGSSKYAEELAILSDDYPDYELQLENEV